MARTRGRARASVSSLLLGLLAAVFVAGSTLACASGAAPAFPASGAPARPGSDIPVDGGPDGVVDEGDGGVAQGPVPQDEVLIIYTGSMELEVTDLRSTVDAATAQIRILGGNVAESHEQNTSGHQGANVTFRVPAARWTDAVTGLRGLGSKVIAEDTDSADVTAQVVDLDARIANLRASEAAVQAIMERAGTITDVLKVQQELTAIRSDIESMVAQRDNLADQAAMGTLQVTFSVPVVAAAVASEGWDLGHEIDSAVAALVRIGQGTTSLGIWLLIVFTPVAIPVLLGFYAAFRVRRWYLARHPAAAAPTRSF